MKDYMGVKIPVFDTFIWAYLIWAVEQYGFKKSTILVEWECLHH